MRGESRHAVARYSRRGRIKRLSGKARRTAARLQKGCRGAIECFGWAYRFCEAFASMGYAGTRVPGAPGEVAGAVGKLQDEVRQWQDVK